MKLTKATKNKFFDDYLTSMQFGNPGAKQRVQIKMPPIVVKELDRLFDKVDRSHLLTQLAIEAIVQKLRFQDEPFLQQMADDSQSGLDDMLEYLEKRDDNTL